MRPEIGVPRAHRDARVTRVTERPQSTIDPYTHGRTVTERTTRETVYLLTSLYPEEAGSEDLLALVRPHGSIEAIHHIEDVSFQADASTIRTGHEPANLTTLTRLASALLQAGGAFTTVLDGQHYGVTRPRKLIATFA